MKKFINAIMNPDYTGFYQFYKKLPGIAAISTMVIFLIWSIVDVIVFRVNVGWYSPIYKYGIFRLESPILSVLIWLAIGVIVSGIVWFFSALTTSATVTRTDAVLKIAEATEEKTEIKE